MLSSSMTSPCRFRWNGNLTMTDTQILCQSHYRSLEKYFKGLEPFLHTLIHSAYQHLAHLFGILISHEDFKHIKNTNNFQINPWRTVKGKKEPTVIRKYLKLNTRISEIALHFQATYQYLSSNHYEIHACLPKGLLEDDHLIQLTYLTYPSH